ncbi:MAG: hypothetical protein AAB834_06740, partial [Patescibacteria group bacterium]
HNLADRTQHTTATNPNDPTDVNEGSGFWLNNPRNTMSDNYAADADAWGYQIDPITINTFSGAEGKTITPIDASGNTLPQARITSLEVVDVSNNRTVGNYFGGMEAINLESVNEQRMYGLTAVSHRRGSFAGFAAALLLESNYWADGTRFGDEDGDGSFYSPGGAITGASAIALGVPHHRFLNSTVDHLNIGYQFPGSLIFQNSAINQQASDSYGTGFLWGIKGNPRFSTLPIHIHFFPTNSTTQHEFYLFDQDGPGQHVKLIPWGTVPPDRLTYTFPSRFSSCTGEPGGFPDPVTGIDSVCYQEALFTGPSNEGVPLRMPFFLNAGAVQDVLKPMEWGKDVVD